MKILMICMSFLVIHSLNAQEAVEEKRFPFTNQFLDIDLEADAELSIKAWNRQEIYVKVTYQVNDGKDNEAIKIDLDNYPDRLALDLDLDPRKLSDTEDCCCDEARSSYYDSGKRTCMNVKIEVMIPASAQVGVETITSDVIIEGMVSDIDVETVTGGIDLTWQQHLGADLNMKTTTGDLYTNLELERKSKRGLPGISSRNLKSLYKGGGKEVKLKSVTGTIYFRKAGE